MLEDHHHSELARSQATKNQGVVKTAPSDYLTVSSYIYIHTPLIMYNISTRPYTQQKAMVLFYNDCILRIRDHTAGKHLQNEAICTKSHTAEVQPTPVRKQ